MTQAHFVTIRSNSRDTVLYARDALRPLYGDLIYNFDHEPALDGHRFDFYALELMFRAAGRENLNHVQSVADSMSTRLKEVFPNRVYTINDRCCALAPWPPGESLRRSFVIFGPAPQG